jgi:hypothetical protein
MPLMMAGATMPMSRALPRIVVMIMFFTGTSHQLSSRVPQARFTPWTSAWKNRMAHQMTMMEEMMPEPSRERMKLLTVVRNSSELPSNWT